MMQFNHQHQTNQQQMLGVYGSFPMNSIRAQASANDTMFVLTPYAGYSDSPPQEPQYLTPSYDDLMSMGLNSPLPPPAPHHNFMFSSATTTSTNQASTANHYDLPNSSPIFAQFAYPHPPAAQPQQPSYHQSMINHVPSHYTAIGSDCDGHSSNSQSQNGYPQNSLTTPKKRRVPRKPRANSKLATNAGASEDDEQKSPKLRVLFGYPSVTPLGMHIPRPKRTVLSKDPTLALRCAVCAQPFERGNSLRRHEQLHTGIKPYQCHPCNKSFSRRDIFRRHQNSARCKLATEKFHSSASYFSF